MLKITKVLSEAGLKELIDSSNCAPSGHVESYGRLTTGEIIVTIETESRESAATARAFVPRAEPKQ
jgi:hypothetical protein